MNCYDFMYAVPIDFKLEIQMGWNTGGEYYSANGNIVWAQQPAKTVREMVCLGGVLHREDAFCNRFKLQDLPALDTSGVQVESNIPNYSFGISPSAFKNPKPWDPDDPFYSRAVTVWSAGNNSQLFEIYTFSGPQIPFYAIFNSWEDGAQADIKDVFNVSYGTLALTFKKATA